MNERFGGLDDKVGGLDGRVEVLEKAEPSTIIQEVEKVTAVASPATVHIEA